MKTEEKIFDPNGNLIFTKVITTEDKKKKLNWDLIFKFLGLISIIISIIALNNNFKQQNIAIKDKSIRDSIDNMRFTSSFGLQQSSLKLQNQEFDSNTINAIQNLYLSNKLTLNKEFSILQFETYSTLYNDIDMITSIPINSMNYERTQSEYLITKTRATIFNNPFFTSLIDSINMILDSYETLKFSLQVIDTLSFNAYSYLFSFDKANLSSYLGVYPTDELMIEKADSTTIKRFIINTNRELEELEPSIIKRYLRIHTNNEFDGTNEHDLIPIHIRLIRPYFNTIIEESKQVLSFCDNNENLKYDEACLQFLNTFLEHVNMAAYQSQNLQIKLTKDCAIYRSYIRTLNNDLLDKIKMQNMTYLSSLNKNN